MVMQTQGTLRQHGPLRLGAYGLNQIERACGAEPQDTVAWTVAQQHAIRGLLGGVGACLTCRGP